MGVKSRKLLSGFMMFLICTVALFGNIQTAKATENETTKNEVTEDKTTKSESTESGATEGESILVEQYGTAVANTEVTYNFSTDLNKEVRFYLYAPVAGDYTFTVNDSAGNVYDTFSITADTWFYVEELQSYGYAFVLPNMPVGDYVFKFTTAIDTEYIVYISLIAPEKPEPILSQTTATVTVGMKITLEVYDTEEKITWTSSKKEVATVNKKGVVTAKKKGTTTITAKTESGKKLKCKVTVKPNKYTETKGTLGLAQGRAVLQVYEASYDSKGNLVLKCRVVNGTINDIVSLDNIKIKFVTDDNKTIGTYSTSKKKISIPKLSTKDFTLKIEKSKLKMKKADLRNATYTISGKYTYKTYSY